MKKRIFISLLVIFAWANVTFVEAQQTKKIRRGAKPLKDNIYKVRLAQDLIQHDLLASV